MLPGAAPRVRHQDEGGQGETPSSHQTLLGVDWKISQSELLASPGTKRIAKVREMIGRALLEDRLHPSEAAKLAGKLNFICSWVFSNVGKA